MKKIVLIALTVFCIIALVACSTPQTIAQMVNIDDLNKSFASDASLASSGAKMVASVSGNTLTFTLTLNQDIDPANVPANLQDSTKTSMQTQVEAIQKAYPDIPSWTMAFVVQNKAGQQLFTVSQDVKGK
jgi:hypothetical protein